MFLQEILKSCARQFTPRKDYSEKGHTDIFKCLSITDSKCEYGYIYLQNDSHEATLSETCLFNRLDNYEIIYPVIKSSKN
jgi:hypothetical protein